MMCNCGFRIRRWYRAFVVSVFFSKATSTVGTPPLPRDPKIQMSTMGKNKLKNTDCGLRKVAFRLALITANMALV